MAMTARRKQICEYYALNPYTSYKKLGEMFHMSANCVEKMMKDEECLAYMDEIAMKEWKNYKKKAMRTMEALAERGNYKATEFILRANGVNPEQKVEVATNDIHITIDDE